jgi:hypothetical protein
MAKNPKAGDKLSMEDVEQIAGAIKTRRENFPDEPFEMTVALVLYNIGDRYSPVECIEQEWTGVKQDIPRGEGVPKCPNGHVLTQGLGLKLGWYQEEI